MNFIYLLNQVLSCPILRVALKKMNISYLKIGLFLTIPSLLGGCASEQLRENTVTTGATTSDLLYEMALSNVAMVRYFNGDNPNENRFVTWNGGATLDPSKLDGKKSVQVGILAPSDTLTSRNIPLGTSLDPTTKKTTTTKGEVTHIDITKTEGDVLPWAYDVTGANIAVNDSEGITPALTVDMAVAHVFHPSMSMPLSRALQQSWAVSPVTDTIAINLLKGYYYDASIAQHTSDAGEGPLYRSGTPPVGCLKGSYRDKTVWIPNDDPEAMANLTHLVQKVMAALEDADERAGARKSGNTPPNTQPQVLISPRNP